MEHSRPRAGQADISAPAAISAIETIEAIIEDAVDAWFAEHSEEMAASIRTKTEDVQVRTLETLCRTIRAQYVRRIQALEATASRNNEALREIRAYAMRADDDLRRLASAVGGLLEETTKAGSVKRSAEKGCFPQ